MFVKENNPAFTKIYAGLPSNLHELVNIDLNLLGHAYRFFFFSSQQTDRTLQAVQYLEAVLFFILTGDAMEHDRMTEKSAFTMYKDTLNLIRFISSKFRHQPQAGSQSANIDAKLQILSSRCQSLLNLKLFKMRRHEVKEFSKLLGEYHAKVTIVIHLRIFLFSCLVLKFKTIGEVNNRLFK